MLDPQPKMICRLTIRNYNWQMAIKTAKVTPTPEVNSCNLVPRYFPSITFPDSYEHWHQKRERETISLKLT